MLIKTRTAKLLVTTSLLLIVVACTNAPKNTSPNKEVDAVSMQIDDTKEENAAGATLPKSEAVIAAPKAESAKAQASNYAILAKSNRYDQIKDEAIRNLAVNAADTNALNALALSYYKKNKLGAARIILERALEKNPNFAPTLTNLAIIDLAENEPTHALSNLKKSMKLDDRNPETLALIGSIYLRNKDFAKALLPLEQSYKKDKLNYQLANNYAIALTKNKSYDQAQKVYEEIMVQNSRDPAILLNYANLLVDYLNKPKDALNLVYKAKFIETEKKEIIDLANKIEKKAKSTLK
jgi:tetratricopeptide (TPR) repeat protein